ncbi:MAG: DUF2169 domain-containing protein [Fibrobacteria bacterium]
MEWLTKIAPGYGPDGTPLLSVLCKRTYVFANGKVAEPDASSQIPFHDIDAFLDEGDPLKNAPKAEAEGIAYKPLTDVILHASAYAPRGNQANHLDVGIMVGGYRKIVRVFGNRKVVVQGMGFTFSPPEPFASMRLDYSRAYGGKDAKSLPGVEYAYAKNPLGKGFMVKNDPALLQGMALPNLEDPNRLLTPDTLVLGKYENWGRQPDPCSFGYAPRNAFPRLAQAGLSHPDRIDAEADRRMRLQDMAEIGAAGQREPPAPMPLLNPEFFNGAPPGLKLPYLKGDETIKLRYLDPDHPAFEFKLNPEKPSPCLDVGEGRMALPATLQTLEIYKATNQYTVVWRGSVKYQGPQSLKLFTKFEFGVMP